MKIKHPIYGPGTVVKSAKGTFSYVKFDRETNVSSHEGPNILCVSLKVCGEI